MAPFRRGKSGPRNNFTASRGTFSRGRNHSRGGFRSNAGTTTASKNAFHASRVEEPADDRSESPVHIPEDGNPDIGSDELLSEDDSSESDTVSEKPYSVLLRTLNPRLPHSEPRKKRPKTGHIVTPELPQESSSGVLDAVEDVETEGNSSEDESLDGSDTVSTPHGNAAQLDARLCTDSFQKMTSSLTTLAIKMRRRPCRRSKR